MVVIKKSTIFDFISSLVLNYKYSDMNIITADFNWISLLLIVGGAVFSIIKSYGKKDDAKSTLQDTDFETEEEADRIYQERESTVDVKERYIMTEETKQTDPLKEKNPIQVISKKEEEIEFDSTIGEEEEEFQLDIRQAIIGSEILRRPKY